MSYKTGKLKTIKRSTVWFAAPLSMSSSHSSFVVLAAGQLSRSVYRNTASVRHSELWSKWNINCRFGRTASLMERTIAISNSAGVPMHALILFTDLSQVAVCLHSVFPSCSINVENTCRKCWHKFAFWLGFYTANYPQTSQLPSNCVTSRAQWDSVLCEGGCGRFHKLDPHVPADFCHIRTVTS